MVPAVELQKLLAGMHWLLWLCAPCNFLFAAEHHIDQTETLPSAAMDSGTGFGGEEGLFSLTDENMATLEKIELSAQRLLPPGPPPAKKVKSASKSKKKKRSTGKQMKMEKALKNMQEKNFQGYEIEKCTVVEGGHCIYLPKAYGQNTRKKFKNRSTPPSHTAYCCCCNLVPCAMLEFEDSLLGSIAKHCGALTTPDEVLEKTLTQFRVLIGKSIGKRYVLKLMPTNNNIPSCVQTRTRHLVFREIGPGYDSMLDEESPSPHERKLNQRDRKMEAEEFSDCGYDYGPFYSSEEDCDDLPLVALKNKK